MDAAAEPRDVPIFFPWMNGERSVEWNPDLRPRWHGRKDAHSSAELARGVLEGVLFNIAQYLEVIERESGIKADEIVLSGNGFRESLAAPLLASLLGRELLLPDSAGLASLRGAAVTAWRALGQDVLPALEQVVQQARRVPPVLEPAVMERFARFKDLRAKG